MTKESAAWLVIRTLGLLALGEALLKLVNVAAELLVVQEFYGIQGAVAASVERQIFQSWVSVGMYFAQAVFFSALSMYFLRKGEAVHRLLMRETS
jgi:hypothetical protein